MGHEIGGSNAQDELLTMTPWGNKAAPITVGEHYGRIDKARQLMGERNIDTLLIGAGASLRYFSGIVWRPSERLVAMLLPRKGAPIFICPSFEEGSLLAALQIEGKMRCWEEDEDPIALLVSILKEIGANKVAIDPQMTFGFTERLRHARQAADIIDASPVIDRCRSIKSAGELALLRQAKQTTLEVQRRAAKILAPGITTGEIKRFVHDAHRSLGAESTAFCVALFGKATAYPHGVPGEQILQEGDMVLIDTGCTIEGYHSDITRSYVFGAPTKKQVATWSLEKAAQQAAFEAVRPGATCESIDAAARRVLEAAGLGPGYSLPGLPHRTGHGVGLSVHEWPYLVRGDRTQLAPDMCFSNEPMIVIPDEFGIRLEDHFYVTEDGAQWFTKPAASIDFPFS